MLQGTRSLERHESTEGNVTFSCDKISDTARSLALIVLIAPWACSIVSIGMNAVVCGKRSWSTISSLPSDVLIDVSGAMVGIWMGYYYNLKLQGYKICDGLPMGSWYKITFGSWNLKVVVLWRHCLVIETLSLSYRRLVPEQVCILSQSRSHS